MSRTDQVVQQPAPSLVVLLGLVADEPGRRRRAGGRLVLAGAAGLLAGLAGALMFAAGRQQRAD